MRAVKPHPLLRIVMDSKQHWLGMTGLVVFALLAGPLQTGIASLWGEVVDLGVAGRTDRALSAACWIVILVLLSSVRTGVHYKIIGHTAEKVFMRFRLRVFSAVARGDMRTLEGRMRSGDLAMRTGDDIDQLADVMSGQLANFIRLISQALFALAACFLLSWQMSAAYLILLPLSLVIMRKISKPMQEQRKAAADATGRAMSLGTDVIGGLTTVKSYHLQNEMNRRFADALNDAYMQFEETEKTGIYMSAVRYFFSVLQIMPLFLIGVWLVRQGTLSVGAVLSFVALSVYVKEAFENMDYLFRVFRSASALAERLFEMIDLPLEGSGSVKSLCFDGTLVSMKDLSFSYQPEGGAKTLKNIHFSLSKNQKIAIIGPSGCGKSTLIHLICRFCTHQSGTMTLFGVDARDIHIEALRQELALVSQDAVLFDGSIYENVAFGRPDASEAEVLQAIKSAGLWDFVSALPNGAHTAAGEFGGQLSGGQRQRICIARAILKDAHIIILDEATSALDTQTEREVQHALDTLLVNRAAIIVSHRLSSVRHVDHLICLDCGRIVEEGTPQELMAAKGYYYQMSLKQETRKEEAGTV